MALRLGRRAFHRPARPRGRANIPHTSAPLSAFRVALRLGRRAFHRPARPRGRASTPLLAMRRGCAAPRAQHFPPCRALACAPDLRRRGSGTLRRHGGCPSSQASTRRFRAALPAAPGRVSSAPPPPSKDKRSALRASRYARRGTRPRAVSAGQPPGQQPLGDRQVLLHRQQLVDFPYRLGDQLMHLQPPGFPLGDRFLPHKQAQLVDFPYRLGDQLMHLQPPGFPLGDRFLLWLSGVAVDFYK